MEALRIPFAIEKTAEFVFVLDNESHETGLSRSRTWRSALQIAAQRSGCKDSLGVYLGDARVLLSKASIVSEDEGCDNRKPCMQSQSRS